MSIDYRNYARSVELNRFATINEGVNQNPQENIKKLFAGKKTPAYAYYWRQIYNQIMQQVDSGSYSGTATVKQTNDSVYATVNWTVDQKTGVCKYSVGQAPTAQPAQQPVQPTAQQPERPQGKVDKM